MKAIRIQIDMIYKVNGDDTAVRARDHDMKFFEEIKRGFNSWGENPNEVRTPVKFDLRSDIIDVIHDEEE